MQVKLTLDQTHTQSLLLIEQQLLAETSPKLSSEEIGREVANIACYIVELVFGDLIQSFKDPNNPKIYQENLESLNKVKHTFTKYVPWAMDKVSLQRIYPIVDFYQKNIIQNSGTEKSLMVQLDAELSARLQQVKLASQQHMTVPSKNLIKNLIDVVDAVVTQLLIVPKKLLNFNIVVDKSLDGVISLTKKIAYHQLEKALNPIPNEKMMTIALSLMQFIEE